MKRRNLLTSSAGFATLPLLSGVSLVTASVAEADGPGYGPWPPPPSYNGLILHNIEGSVYPFFRPWKGKRPFPRPSFKGTVRVTKFGYKRGLSCDGFIYGNLVNPWGKPFQPIYPQPFYYVPADLTCDDDKGHGGGDYGGGYGGGGYGGGGGGGDYGGGGGGGGDYGGGGGGGGDYGGGGGGGDYGGGGGGGDYGGGGYPGKPPGDGGYPGKPPGGGGYPGGPGRPPKCSNLTLDIGAIKLLKDKLIVDPDAVDLDDGLKRSPLQGLLCALCDLLDNLDHFDPRKFKELKDLLDAINAILSKYKIVIEV